ncbi:MAG: hypothetical protein HQL97_10740 [Magnetococcales bacterium]|nr:hypothetical protein [Magnetococcales bacterium]
MYTLYSVLLTLMLFLAPAQSWAAGTIEAGGGGSSGGGGGDASAANQTTIIGHVDGIEGLIGTTNTNTGTVASAVQTEDAAHSSGEKGIMLLGVRNDSGATTLSDTNGDYTPLAVDSLGRLFIVQTSIAPGTAAGHLGKAEDAAHGSGDTGVMALCVRRDTAATSATTDGDYNPCATDASGRLHTTNPAIESTRMRVTMYDSSGAEVVVPTAGLTSYTAAGASTNATNVKNAAGTVYGYTLTNTTTTIYYLRMYNLASAPTCSSATGYVSTIPIPPASAAGGAGGREIQKNIGQAFTTGIGFCVTGGASSTDNTNAATGVFVEVLYK